MIVLSKEEVIEFHEIIIKETGGVLGIKDEGLLESALAAPFITFEGEDLYPSIIQKAARLGYGLVCNHSFVDGNKRIAAISMIIFLEYNNIHLDFKDDDLADIFINIASNLAGYNDLLNWINNHLI